MLPAQTGKTAGVHHQRQDDSTIRLQKRAD